AEPHLSSGARGAWVGRVPARTRFDTSSPGSILINRAFGMAWLFFAAAAVLGVILRVQMVRPIGNINYSYLLHAHSHVAFLGWIFNAFFALSLRFFVGPDAAPGFRGLFWLLQVAVFGMLVSYPLQGYAAWSISFSTLHMIGSGVFAWKLWKSDRVGPAAGGYLRVGLAFMLISGLGPLTLGPLAALGLRDSPGYTLAIYFYLHCQYNGWFMFFLQAVLLQHLEERGQVIATHLVRRALAWSAAGCVLTFALSTLWTGPAAWVRWIALAGGAAQVIGFGYFVAGLRPVTRYFASSWKNASVRLLTLAVGAYLLKLLLQYCGALPGFAGLVNNRFVVIGFIHLIFLGIVTPLLVAWAIELGWIAWNRWVKLGLALYLGGALITEATLAGQPWNRGGGPWANPAPLLLGAAMVLAAGVLVLAGARLLVARRT
ncbi:MAG TPA: hypothetical protein VFJ90_16310, partial [Candidatus Didemnitutus sp.]|nr:hypothetical protein [Candidatus Didemnitutus sp.]